MFHVIYQGFNIVIEQECSDPMIIDSNNIIRDEIKDMVSKGIPNVEWNAETTPFQVRESKKLGTKPRAGWKTTSNKINLSGKLDKIIDINNTLRSNPKFDGFSIHADPELIVTRAC